MKSPVVPPTTPAVKGLVKVKVVTFYLRGQKQCHYTFLGPHARSEKNNNKQTNNWCSSLHRKTSASLCAALSSVMR